jgi:glucosylceramidase
MEIDTMNDRIDRTTRAVAAVALALVVSGASARSEEGPVTAWLTQIDDGTRKQAAATPCDEKQDATYALLKEASIPLKRETSGAAVRIVVNPGTAFQVMHGLGGAMTDSSAWVLQQLKQKNPALHHWTMDRLFSPAEGAGYSYLRLPMGASDYTATERLYTYCDDPSPDLSKFSIAHDREYILPALKDALRINPELEIMGTPWSPPAWMKTHGRLTGISEAEKKGGATNRLKPDCFEVYADYFVKFLKAYEAEGVRVHAVTLQNEPQFDAASYPCLRMDEDEQIKLVTLLGPRIKAAGLQTAIFIHDHNWVLHPNDRRTIGGDRKTEPIDLVKKILSDPAAAPWVTGSAWHCYSGGAAEMRRAYQATLAAFPDKPVYCTELSGWGKKRGEWFGDVDWGLKHNWLGGPQNGASVALQWNLALNHEYGPTLRTDSAAVWLVTVWTDTFREAVFEREFYAMAQISKAARPGARRVETTVRKDGKPAGDIETLGFRLKDGRTSLVVYNSREEEVPAEVECEGRYFKARIPGRSLVTFVWRGP